MKKILRIYSFSELSRTQKVTNKHLYGFEQISMKILIKTLQIFVCELESSLDSGLIQDFNKIFTLNSTFYKVFIKISFLAVEIYFLQGFSFEFFVPINFFKLEHILVIFHSIFYALFLITLFLELSIYLPFKISS